MRTLTSRTLTSRTLKLRAPKNDRGSVSVWVVLFAFVTLTMLVLVVDGGEVMIAKSRAADIAEQAARAGADDINQADLQAGEVVINQAACDGDGPAANLIAAYAKGIDVSASMQHCELVTENGEPGVEVWVQVSMRPAIPSSIFPRINVSTHDVAYLQCGTADQVQAC
jgi:Putative Flp pilus-assembly TadE/G-like